MKISEMKGEQAFDAMAKLVPHLYRIIEDNDLSEVKEDIKKGEKENIVIQKAMPTMLTKHREDLFALIAATNDKTIEDVKNMTYADIMNALRECGIAEIIDFFRFAVRLIAVS